MLLSCHSPSTSALAQQVQTQFIVSKQANFGRGWLAGSSAVSDTTRVAQLNVTPQKAVPDIVSPRHSFLGINDYLEQIAYTPRHEIPRIVEISCDVMTNLLAKKTPPRQLVVLLRQCHKDLSHEFNDSDSLIIVKRVFFAGVVAPILVAPWKYFADLGALSMDQQAKSSLQFACDCVQRLCDGTLLLELGETLSVEQRARVTAISTAFDDWIAGMAFPLFSPRSGIYHSDEPLQSVGSAAATAATRQCPPESPSVPVAETHVSDESSSEIMDSMNVEVSTVSESVAPSGKTRCKAATRSRRIRKPSGGDAASFFRSESLPSFQKDVVSTKISLLDSADDQGGCSDDSDEPTHDSVSSPSPKSPKRDELDRMLDYSPMKSRRGSKVAAQDDSANASPLLEHGLTTLWGDKTNLKSELVGKSFTIVVLVRSLGCAVTRRSVSKLTAWIPSILSLFDARIICITTGEVGKSVANFRETTGFDGSIYFDSDPKHGIFEKFGCLRSWKRAVFNMKSFLALSSAVARGFTDDNNQGDRRQLGGVALLDRDGNVAMKHIETFAGESLLPQQLLRALGADEATVERLVPDDAKRSKSVPRNLRSHGRTQSQRSASCK